MVTAPIRTHEVRVGDLVTMPDGTHGEVTDIRDHGTKVVFRVASPVEVSYHILTDDQQVEAVLEA